MFLCCDICSSIASTSSPPCGCSFFERFVRSCAGVRWISAAHSACVRSCAGLCGIQYRPSKHSTRLAPGIVLLEPLRVRVGEVAAFAQAIAARIINNFAAEAAVFFVHHRIPPRSSSVATQRPFIRATSAAKALRSAPVSSLRRPFVKVATAISTSRE